MTLYVSPVSAMLTRDTQLFSAMDPYCVVKVGNQQKKTRTHNEGGKKPKWSDVLKFQNINSNIRQLTIKVMDEDVITDDHVGTGTLNLSNIFLDSSEHKQYVPLTYNGKPAGKVYISVRYAGGGQYNGQMYGGGYQQPYGQSYNSNPYGGNNNNPYGNSMPIQQQPYGQSPQYNMPMNQGFGSMNQGPMNQGSSPNAIDLLGAALSGGLGNNKPQQANLNNNSNSGWGNPNPNNGWGNPNSNNNGWGNPNSNNNGWGNPNSNNNGWGNPNSNNNGWGLSNNGW